VGAEGTDLEGLDGQLEVVDRRGGRGEVEDVVEFPRDMDEVGHVVLDENELRASEKALDVVERAGDEVVHAHHLKPLVQQPATQM